jgi:hypothetical protein
MVTVPLIQRSALCMLFGLAVLVNAGAQGQRVELLLPGSEYHQSDLPPDPSGPWWVLHQPAGQPVLEAMELIVTPFRSCGDDDAGQTGRAVEVPNAQGSILLLRGLHDLGSGSVRTDFVDTAGTGAYERVEVPWNDTTVIVRRSLDDPQDGRPGRYQIELLIGTIQYQLHTDQWHGDGHWWVRWIRDLNRDGWPDVLLDASYKYSVHTTRLFLSRIDGVDGDAPVFDEVGTLSSSAC